MSVKILFSGAPLRTVHAPKLLYLTVSENVIFKVGKFLKLFTTDTAGTLETTLMIVVDNFQMSDQSLLRSADC